MRINQNKSTKKKWEVCKVAKVASFQNVLVQEYYKQLIISKFVYEIPLENASGDKKKHFSTSASNYNVCWYFKIHSALLV